MLRYSRKHNETMGCHEITFRASHCVISVPGRKWGLTYGTAWMIAIPKPVLLLKENSLAFNKIFGVFVFAKLLKKITVFLLKTGVFILQAYGFFRDKLELVPDYSDMFPQD